jgi:hypothetical protein
MSLREQAENLLEQLEENDPSMVPAIKYLLDLPVPMLPRITKSTAVAAIRARFEGDGDLLERFEVAKNLANLWDGERDGLREAVKVIVPKTYTSVSSGSTVVLTRTETAKVLYPNASGKHQLENCLQCSIPEIIGVPEGAGIIAFLAEAPDGGSISPKAFLDLVLHHLQTSKEAAVKYLETAFVGSGQVVDNATLFEKKGSEKSAIAIIPKED